nr:MAG TPA: hypothetical protein [Caudoviricetes sp.]DAI58416.1 MAG TPA: hypothetical protein [Crassvirales sp.]DAJ71012.1 MAG TPA: hypothetical protein [Caudoviricetes sp.]DAJ78491.1 MAG TPA: hypothetical protein [Crassvirales sp.]DAR30971.1 MAG TPA: hypothetical protein [Caudoviricetes sp.]
MIGLPYHSLKGSKTASISFYSFNTPSSEGVLSIPLAFAVDDFVISSIVKYFIISIVYCVI